MKPKLNEAKFPRLRENLLVLFVSLVVMEVFKFKNSTSDGEKIYQSGEMTLQYVSYSADGPMTLR